MSNKNVETRIIPAAVNALFNNGQPYSMPRPMFHASWIAYLISKSERSKQQGAEQRG